MMALLNPSMINRNRRGERWHPYLSPLSDREKGVASPFSNTMYVTSFIKLMIHLM